MLKQRIITAAVLIPPLLVALFQLPTVGIAILFGVVVAAAAWEWGGLCGWRRGARATFLVAVVIAGGALIAATLAGSDVVFVVFSIAALWWLFMLVELARRTGGVFRSQAGRVVAGLLILVPAWVALTFLHAVDTQPPLLLLFVLVLVGVADTAAYAAGHAFGRTKLAASISPGKTVEGVAGGVLGALLLAYVCGTMIWHLEGARLGAWLALAAVTALVSVLGDLAESKMKRIAGVKDSGRLLPGHGGVLDRIDALTAAAPVFALGWLVLFGLSA